MSRTIVIAVALSLAWTAAAQPVLAPAVAPPAPKADSLSYRSALADYRSWQEADRLPWRAANDSAAALGGHSGQLRGSVERIQAKPPQPTPPANTGAAQ